MSRELNQQQRLAIDPQNSARVMANAGAGKTFILTARVLRLLLRGTPPGKILCLTYTKAAAAEMRERINKQLEKWVLMDEAQLRADVAQLIEAEPDAKQIAIARKLFSSTLESSPPPRIQTIHSFCQDVLKRFPLESGIQPYFEVVDDITSRELIKETTQTLLSRHNVDKEVVEAIDYIASEAGENKFNSVIGEIISQRNRIMDLFEKVRKPELLVEYIYRENDCSTADKPEDYISIFMQQVTAKLAELKALQSALANGGKRDNQHAEKLQAAINSKSFSDYYKVFFGDKAAYSLNYFMTKGALAKFAPGEEWILREQQLIGEVAEKLVKYENLKFTKHVIYLAAGILGAYESVKRNRAVIDYNDLIYTTKKLLNSGNSAWVLYKLDGGIDHILIDEAQDTSPDQWQIVLALLSEFLAGDRDGRTIFIVGDEKQSIYSFQGADQKAFNEITNYIQQKCNEAKMRFSDLELKTSFRSVEAVLKLADNVFEPEHLRKSITSKEKINHELKRMGEGGRVEIWPLVRSESEDELENWSLPLSYISAKSADLMLAEKIADTIAEWISSGRKLASQNRPVQPSDFLILLRSRGEIADMLINRLKRRGVEVSGSDRLKITEHIAIQDLMALANFLLLPTDDLSLAAALKSPLFNVDEDQLFELCYNRNSSVWDNLRARSEFSDITSSLEQLRNAVDYLSVYELYSLVLDQQGGRKKFISRLGHEVNDVLDEFLDLSVNFERSHTNSLQQFISWVALSNMEIKRDMEATGNQVRIMTVHGSKGLEAPIVFLADAAKLPTPKRQLIWNDNYFYAYRTKEKTFSGLKASIAEAEQADYDEYLRLLYVAMTRARDELYVTGSLGRKNANIDKSWYRLVENALRIFGTESNDSFSYETVQEKPLKLHEQEKPQEKIKLPDFLLKKLPVEEVQVHETEEFHDLIDEINQGNKIHKTLEVIGKLAPEKREDYLHIQFPDNKNIVSNLLSVLNKPELAHIFSKNSLAEVPVIGKINGEVVTGRIDRLVVTDGKVLVVDFKTASNPPKKMPEKYIKQLDAYKQLIAPQYPGYLVETAILWVSTGKLEQLP